MTRVFSTVCELQRKMCVSAIQGICMIAKIFHVYSFFYSCEEGKFFLIKNFDDKNQNGKKKTSH